MLKSHTLHNIPLLFEDTPVIASCITIKNNIEIKNRLKPLKANCIIVFIGFRFMWKPYVVILCI